MSTFVINAELREDVGKGASRRLRRLERKVPCIVYGGGKEPQNISVLHKDLTKATEDESFYSQQIALIIGTEKEPVLLKDMQRHPAKPRILHVDFLRIDKNTPITTRVPLHFVNETKCEGVKLQGGRISHIQTTLEISCLPGDLPEFIEVDMQPLEAGTILHISDVQLPEGVTAVALKHGADYDSPVVSVLTPRAEIDEDSEGDEEESSSPTED